MPKWTRTLGVVLAVFALAYSVSRIPRPTSRPETPPVPTEIERIEISGQVLRTKVAFVRSGERWSLSDPLAYPAEDTSVVSLLAAVRSMRIEAALSRREAAVGLFGLDDAQGIRLSLWAPRADRPLIWVIGKNAPDGLRVYARTPGRPEIFLVKGILREALEIDPDKWREGRILPLDPGDEVASVRVRRGRSSFILARGSASWTLDGFPTDRAVLDRTMNAFLSGTVAEFVDPPASLDLRRFDLLTPQGEIAVALADGRERVLRIGKEEKGDSPRLVLRRDGEPTLLWVPAQALELYRTNPRNLKTVNLPEKKGS